MNTLFIVLNSLRLLFRRPIWIVFTICAPILFVFVIGLTVTNSKRGDARIPLLVVNQDGGVVADEIVRAIAASNVVALDKQTDEAAARDAIKQRHATAAIILPAGLSASVSAGKDADVAFLIDQTSPSRIAIQQELNAILGRIGGAYHVAQVATEQAAQRHLLADDAAHAAYFAAALADAHARLSAPAVTVSATQAHVVRAEVRPQMATGFNQSAPGSAVHWAMLGALSVSGFIVDERQRGTLRRLMVMPIRRAEILLGTMLLGFFVAILQIGILIGFGALLGVRWGNDPLALGMVVVCYALAMAGLSMMFACVLRSRAQAMNFGIALSNLAAPLAGAWFPRELLPPGMLTVGKVFPSGWAMEAFIGVIVRNTHVADVVVPCLVMLGFAAVSLAIGVRRFRFE